MSDRAIVSSPRSAALTAGAGYMIIFLLAMFANFLVKEGLIVAGDAVSTAENIQRSAGLFRAGMVSFLVVFLVDIPIAWGLYVLLKPVHRDLSLLAAWFRLGYTVFLGVALVFYFQALQYLDGGILMSPFDQRQLQVSAYVALESFNAVWLIGLTAFGMHLIITGFLLLRSSAAPKFLAWFLVMAGFAYIADTVARILLADYSSVAGLFLALVAVPSVFGEGWFGLWLLIKGPSAFSNKNTGV